MLKKKNKTTKNKRKQKLTQTKQHTAKYNKERKQRIWAPNSTAYGNTTQDENQNAPPNTTSTAYASYRETGVYEWKINTSERITYKHQKPDNHIDEEFER